MTKGGGLPACRSDADIAAARRSIAEHLLEINRLSVEARRPAKVSDEEVEVREPFGIDHGPSSECP